MKVKLFDGIALILSLSVFVLFFIYGYSSTSDDGYLLIESDDGQFLYNLAEDRTLIVEGPSGESLIVIENGKARFKHSDCQDQLCVQMGEIEHSGEWAACLPNEIFIAIEGHEEVEIDATVF